MTTTISMRTGDAPEIEAFLEARLYEHNARATGYFDAEAFSAIHRDDSGAIQAGVSGYTWGGCCHITYLWVSESMRGRGMGAALLEATEQHARTKQCALVLVASHDFQAPGFYEQQGYLRQAAIRDNPVGHIDIIFAKRLDGKVA